MNQVRKFLDLIFFLVITFQLCFKRATGVALKAAKTSIKPLKLLHLVYNNSASLIKREILRDRAKVSFSHRI